MSFIVTASGDELDVRYPTPAHITPFTIAWHLSQINRFTGACLRPYSVAEHSLLVCEIAERELHLDLHGLFLALMHDAHEAFCGDQVSPMKVEIGEAWGHHEGKWLRVVGSVFSLSVAQVTHGAKVRQADLMALASEREALLPRTPTPWAVLQGIQPVPWAVHDVADPARRQHDWEFWRDRWLDRFHELEFQRNDRHWPVQQP